ncbi:MAG: isochorismatase family cysteine hydrolase [Acidobacteriaceae bacterium]
MTDPASLDLAHTAVLSMDMQAGIISLYVSDGTFVSRAAEVLDRCRAHHLPVIHVRVGFRPGLPEVSERNPLFGAIRNSPEHQKLFEGEAGAVHPLLGPKEGDIEIVKHRVSAFTGTDLEMILRAQSVETVVLFGIATSGVVLSTLLDAGDADYRVIVIRDCCGDREPELHAALLDKLFPRRGTVMTAAEFLGLLPA